MPVKATTENIESNRVMLTVEVPVEEMSAAIDRAFSKIGRNVKIDGFRQGKVPRDVIEKRFGVSAALEEVFNDDLGRWYFEAVSETGIRPVDRPNIEFPDEYDAEKVREVPLRFTAEVDVIPEFKVAAYKGLEIGKMPEEATEEELSESMDKLRDRFARLEVAEGRPVEDGDFAMLDLIGYLHGEKADETTDFLVQVGAHQILEDFEKQLPGMVKDETRKFDVTFPENYQRQDFSGETLQFECTLKEIKVKVLPEMDDEFAKEVGFDSLEEMRKSIADDLNGMKKGQATMVFKKDVLKAVSDATPIDIPESFINARGEELFREFLSSLNERETSLEDYCAIVETTTEQLVKEAHDQAAIQIKNELILDTIAETEGMDISEEELMEELRANAGQLGQDAETLREQIRRNNSEGSLKQSMLRDKVLTFLTDEAVPVKYVPPAETGEEEKAEAGSVADEEAPANEESAPEEES